MVAACPFPLPRGTPIRIYQMAAALARRGHDVHVVSYHLGDPAPDAPFRIHRIRTIRGYRKTSAGPSLSKLAVLDPLLTLKLRRLLREGAYDVIHAHHYEGLLAAAAARPRGGPPIVFDVHTLLESELPYYGPGIPAGVKRAVGGALDRWAPRWADHVIAVTAEMRARLLAREATRSDQISMIPNGVESRAFDCTPRPRAGAGNGHPRRVIFTGNLAPYQGIDLLLEAFHSVRARRDDVRLVIVSEDSFDRYEQRAVDLGIRPYIDFHRVGFAEVPRLLGSAEVALNPRVGCDGLPQKLLNYMASGRPVVSFAGSARHLVDGEHGVVVEDNDTEGFASAIDRLLSDEQLAARMGAAGKELVRSSLSWDATAAKVEGVYQRLL
jgi:glycosyltransferase involved in cell wall biosynthesis